MRLSKSSLLDEIRPPTRKSESLPFAEDISKSLGEENVLAWGSQTYSDWLSQDEINKNCKSISATEAKTTGVDQKICFPVGQGLDLSLIHISEPTRPLYR